MAHDNKWLNRNSPKRLFSILFRRFLSSDLPVEAKICRRDGSRSSR